MFQLAEKVISHQCTLMLALLHQHYSEGHMWPTQYDVFKIQNCCIKNKTKKNNPGSLDYFFHSSDLQSAAVPASVQAGQWLWTQELQGARVRMQTQELAELAAKGRRLLHWRLEAGWMVPLEWTGRRWSWTGGTDTGEVIIIKWKKKKNNRRRRQEEEAGGRRMTFIVIRNVRKGAEAATAHVTVE